MLYFRQFTLIMRTNPERSKERGTEETLDTSRERSENRDRSIDVVPITDTNSATADSIAIESARARALAAGVTAREEEPEEYRHVFNFATRAKDTVVEVGKGGLQVMGGSLVALTYLGYQASRPVLFTAAHALDWIGQKMNSWADKLIDKKFPVLSWLINPLVSLIDKSAKSLGIDKTLAEHLKKNAEDRKKLAQKVFKDYMEAQKKYEKKVEDAAKKKVRQKKIKEVLGEDVAAALEEEFEDLENAEAAKAEPAPAAAPAETPKAA